MPTRLQLSCRVAIEYGLPLYLLTGDERKKTSSKNGSKSGLALPHGACVEICREMSLFEEMSNRDDSAPAAVNSDDSAWIFCRRRRSSAFCATISTRNHTMQWRNCNFWAPRQHSLTTVLIHYSGHFGPPLPFWALPPRHCRGCRWLVTPLTLWAPRDASPPTLWPDLQNVLRFIVTLS